MSFLKQRNPAFDLYRAVAVLAVVIGHIGLYMDIPTTIYGWIKPCLVIPINYGVPIFFIISGYLLAGSMTSLSAIPQNNTYIQSLKKFYYLRACRIYPAYIFWLFTLLLLQSCIAKEVNISNAIKDFIVHLFNIHNIFSQYCRSINPVFWTLAVEFQWYILAPAIFYLMLGKSKKIMLITFGLILVLSIVSRNWIALSYFAQNISIEELWRLSNEQVYVELYSFGFGIIIWRYRQTEWRLSSRYIALMWVGLFIISVYTYSFYFTIDGKYGVGIQRLLSREESYIQFIIITNMKYVSQLILAYIVFHYRNISMPKLLYLAVQYIATISYSMYIIHYPILTLIFAPSDDFISAFGVYLTITFIVSTVSYIFIEKPFIDRAKKKSFIVVKREQAAF